METSPKDLETTPAVAGVAGEEPGFQLGQRVHSVGDPRRTGTVRYVGAVEGYPGAWVGVDWDDGNGKHDGALNNTRYFAARGVTTASFVRPKNLSSGITFLEALRLRYSGDSSKEDEDEMYVLSARNKRVSVELVGKDKIREKLKHYQELLCASVSYMGVGSIGDPHEINTVIPNLKEVDLTGNLLSTWQDVGIICDALPALEILNLTSNQLEKTRIKIPLLKHIRVLVLNNCGISWKEVDMLKQALPAIEELHMMGNSLMTITHTSLSTNYVEGFNSLKILNLEDNNFESWDEIVKLSQLRSLEQLQLNTNRLKQIYYPHNAKSDSSTENGFQHSVTMPFQNLRCLLLGSNKIEDLDSVDSLDSFPCLVDIRLSENPIVDPIKDGIPRFVLVARLAKVAILNGSEVSPRERKESEIRYLRLVMGKMQSCDPAELSKLHPRFFELKLLHGIDEEKTTVGLLGPQKMSSGLLSITFKYIGASLGEKELLTKRLPPTTTIGKLKVLCVSFYNLKSIRPRLLLQEEGTPFPSLLDDEMATLVDLGIASGMTILVDEEV